MNVDEHQCIDDRVHRAVLDEALPPDSEAIGAIVRMHAPLADDAAVADVVRRVQARMEGLGLLDDVLADESVSDVMVNGPGAVWVERRGRLAPSGVVLAEDDVHRLVERIVNPLGLRADRRNPLVDARLPDGARVHIAMPPLAVDGPYVTFRRFSARTLALTEFASEDVAARLVDAVRARRSIIVSGGTGAGKTTLLNALCQHLNAGERVVTVEDAAELRLPGDHVVRLEGRPGTADGLDAVSIRVLVRNALRMRPDRLIVGEVRGQEAQALSKALRRLETMMLSAGVDLPLAAVRDQLIGAVDLIVHVERSTGGRRRITHVHRVTEPDDRPARTAPLVVDGVVEDDRW